VRIIAQVEAALGDARSVVNVGAGTGSYEPVSRQVIPVEIASTMIEQRPLELARAVRGDASRLPLADASVDAGLAILTIHHWADQAAGLAELMRVTRGPVVLLTWDPDAPHMWLTDYFPEIPSCDRPLFPGFDALRAQLGEIEIQTVWVPHDCTDGFLCAYWRRPEAYLDADARAAISTFSRFADLSDGLERLERDLETGEWARRNADILDRTEMDYGYRLVIARSTNPTPTR
jgi:SAM-dependent methyltransferase